MNNIDRLLNSLTKIKGRKGSWTACCPAHPDKSPSLAVRQLDDGRILLHCFGGCSVHDVLGAVGMDMSDLFPEKLENKGAAKPAFYASDLLRVISFETLVISVGAMDMSKGRVLGPKDLARMKKAAERIQEATRYANV